MLDAWESPRSLIHELSAASPEWPGKDLSLSTGLQQPALVFWQAVEGDHSSFPVRPIRNEQPLLILLAWLPALACRELQVFLSGWLRRLCEASLPSRLTCVKAGMVGCLLGALATEGPLF